MKRKDETNPMMGKKVWHRKERIKCHNPACKKILSIYNPNLYCFSCVIDWVDEQYRPNSAGRVRYKV